VSPQRGHMTSHNFGSVEPDTHMSPSLSQFVFRRLTCARWRTYRHVVFQACLTHALVDFHQTCVLPTVGTFRTFKGQFIKCWRAVARYVGISIFRSALRLMVQVRQIDCFELIRLGVRDKQRLAIGFNGHGTGKSPVFIVPMIAGLPLEQPRRSLR